jgi:hypothetical protein
MKSYGTSNITNGKAVFTVEPPADERTPLLSSKNKRVAAVDVVSCKADGGAQSDEEAARWGTVADKPAQQEKSRNIGGVISVLLIGT